MQLSWASDGNTIVSRINTELHKHTASVRCDREKVLVGYSGFSFWSPPSKDTEDCSKQAEAIGGSESVCSLSLNFASGAIARRLSSPSALPLLRVWQRRNSGRDAEHRWYYKRAKRFRMRKSLASSHNVVPEFSDSKTSLAPFNCPSPIHEPQFWATQNICPIARKRS